MTSIESFPYKREFIDPEELWNNCVSLDLAPISVLNMPEVNTNRSRGWSWIPSHFKWKYEGQLVAVVMSKDAYEKVNKLVDYFSEEARMHARRKNNISPYDFYCSNYELIRKKALELQKTDEVLPFRYWVREAIYNLVYECTTFKISVTKSILTYFKSKSVLDPSAGWGDRLLGAAAAGVEVYHGVDPNSKLHNAYDEMITFIQKHGCGQNYKVEIEDFLKVNLTRTYDTVFTSPPYFDYEIYSDDQGQSVQGRTNINKWISDFLCPYIRKAWNVLDEDGHLILHMHDVSNFRCIETMHRFIGQVLKGKYVGVIAMTNDDLKHAYPIWVWKK